MVELKLEEDVEEWYFYGYMFYLCSFLITFCFFCIVPARVFYLEICPRILNCMILLFTCSLRSFLTKVPILHSRSNIYMVYYCCLLAA